MAMSGRQAVFRLTLFVGNPTLPSSLSLRSGVFLSIRNQSTETVSSLKQMMKPFFLKCHPDVQATATAKRVNLKALQTINGFLDLTEATCQGRVVEWPTRTLEIEFLFPTKERIKKDIVETTSRRKVELRVPSSHLRDAITISQEKAAVGRLQHFVRVELSKLLTVAGISTPVVLPEDAADGDAMEAAWDAEMDFVHGNDKRGGGGRRFQQASRYERSRQKFMNSVDWGHIQKLTREAVQDMEVDLATTGLVRNNTKQRQEVITRILSRTRIADDADISMVDQLIALRRLSLILHDNFDDLHMEDMGRMWENLVLVFKGERDYSTSSSSMRKRRQRSLETGYEFSYGANEVVTIHIPIDFGDEELVRELDRNLWDFYNLIGEGVEHLYPKWFTEED